MMTTDERLEMYSTLTPQELADELESLRAWRSEIYTTRPDDLPRWIEYAQERLQEARP